MHQKWELQQVRLPLHMGGSAERPSSDQTGPMYISHPDQFLQVTATRQGVSSDCVSVTCRRISAARCCIAEVQTGKRGDYRVDTASSEMHAHHGALVSDASQKGEKKKTSCSLLLFFLAVFW